MYGGAPRSGKVRLLLVREEAGGTEPGGNALAEVFTRDLATQEGTSGFGGANAATALSVVEPRCFDSSGRAMLDSGIRVVPL